MKRSEPLFALVMAAGLLSSWAVRPVVVHAETPATQPAASNDDDDEIHLAPIAVGKGDENKRINMAARGGKIPNVFVICPERTACTALPQPVLYWAVSEATKDRIDIAVIEPTKPTPLFKETLHGVTAGLHRLDLADEHHPAVPLVKGKDYKFTVSLTERQSGDTSETTFSSGFIRLVDAPTIDKPSPAKLANAGLWCEAIDLLCKRIQADPENQTLRKRRVDLFRNETVFVNPGAEAVANSGPKLEDTMLNLLDAPDSGISK
jgi:hypothetical protein